MKVVDYRASLHVAEDLEALLWRATVKQQITDDVRHTLTITDIGPHALERSQDFSQAVRD